MDELVSGVPSQYKDLIIKAAKQYGIPPRLLSALLKQESSFAEDVITGSRKSVAGALGIAQFMPQTAQAFGINPLDPNQAIPAAAKYIADSYKKFGSWELALAAYNAGGGAVGQYGGIPPYPETQNYVQRIMSDFSGNEKAYASESSKLPPAPEVPIGTTQVYNKQTKKWEIAGKKSSTSLTPQQPKKNEDFGSWLMNGLKDLFSQATPTAYASAGLMGYEPQKGDMQSRNVPGVDPLTGILRQNPTPSLSWRSPIPQQKSYTTQSGDTLWGIAERNLGSGSLWNKLTGYGGDPRQLPIGQKIGIPSPQPAVKPTQNIRPTFTPAPTSAPSAGFKSNIQPVQNQKIDLSKLNVPRTSQPTSSPLLYRQQNEQEIKRKKSSIFSLQPSF